MTKEEEKQLDAFAGQALIGLVQAAYSSFEAMEGIKSLAAESKHTVHDEIAEVAYLHAHAMAKAKKKLFTTLNKK